MAAVQQLLAAYPAVVGNSFRYWRLNITATNTAGHTAVIIAEIEARTTIGGADVTSPSTTMFASYSDGGQPPSMAVDNNTSTIWSLTKSSTSTPWWIEMDLSAATQLAQIAITRLANAAGFNGAPGAFTVQGSNDRVSYTDVKSFSGVDWNPTTPVVFNL